MHEVDHPLRHLATSISRAPAGCHPALLDRAEIASLARSPVSRPSAAPNYISDLGLRRSPDPADFLTHALAGRHDIVSFAGAWQASVTAARAIIRSGRPATTCRLLTYLGSILSHDESSDAGALFLRAGVAPDAGEVDAAMAKIRFSAWSIKRRSDFDTGLTTLRAVRRDLTQAMLDRRVSDGDARVLEAITVNLEALVAVRRRELDSAGFLMDRAARAVEGSRVVMVGDSERRRYSAQIEVNRAQLLVGAGKYGAALNRLETVVAGERGGDSASLSEALALSGYVHYRCGGFQRASELLSEAESLIAREGAPSRLALVRKNLAAATALSGDDEGAGDVLRRIADDPIGSSLVAEAAA
ncbi:hypothetical protein EDF46_2246 [Frondihabitans sp. PhB188]|nr:hypothetical protein EDF46_2246 [Frondihabitans sp. PhB188]